MDCELCRKKLKEGELVVPVGTMHIWRDGQGEVLPKSRAIHVACLREILTSIRSLLP